MLGRSIETDAGTINRVSELPSKPFHVLTIYLNGNVQVGDRDLKRLKGLTKLTYLDLSRTKVSDAGLEYLKGLPALTTLKGTQVTAKGIAALQAALPNCKTEQ